MIFFETPEPG